MGSNHLANVCWLKGKKQTKNYTEYQEQRSYYRSTRVTFDPETSVAYSQSKD